MPMPDGKTWPFLQVPTGPINVRAYYSTGLSPELTSSRSVIAIPVINMFYHRVALGVRPESELESSVWGLTVFRLTEQATANFV